ncbi:YciI family protein [soil metagenome]
MKFMTLVKGREGQTQPPPALFGAIAKLGEDAAKAGVFVTMGGLMPTSAGAVARLSKGRITVTDGPFAETKEVIGGYAIYETKTKAEALEWTRRFLDIHRQHWPEWEGEVEVRQLMEQPAP